MGEGDRVVSLYGDGASSASIEDCTMDWHLGPTLGVFMFGGCFRNRVGLNTSVFISIFKMAVVTVYIDKYGKKMASADRKLMFIHQKLRILVIKDSSK